MVNELKEDESLVALPSYSNISRSEIRDTDSKITSSFNDGQS